MPADELADFGRLVETHYRAVVAVAYATTRDVALAEDIAQDTFIAAWDAREKLRDAAKVRPWLCSIARNKSRNALRSRKREVAEEADVADPKPSVVDRAVEREADAELHAALAEVPMTYREPLVLFYWEQKSIAQVASALAITEEAAQKRISRGRSFLRDGLEASLEGASRGRRTAAAAAAAVLAILATRTAAQAAAAKKGSTTMLKVFGALGVAGLVVGTVAVVHGRASDAASRDVTPPTPVERVPSKTSPRAPALPTDEPPRIVMPSGYELTVLDPMNVAVRLTGGKSDLPVWEPPVVPAIERHVTGRVVDAAKKPIAGAVVVIGSRLQAKFGDLTGTAGAMTSADGTFTVTVHEEIAMQALALHVRGWSSIVSIPAGRGDAAITMVAPTPGSLMLHVRQSGAPRAAQVTLTLARGGIEHVESADEKGDIAFPLLPPGEYSMSVSASHLATTGGTSAPIRSLVGITSGRTTEVPVTVPTGTRISASAFKPGMHMIAYYLYPGTDRLELAELERRDVEVTRTRLGGENAEDPATLFDVTPGIYTLCVDAVNADTTHRPFTCKQISVDDKPTLDVTVDVR